MAPWQATGRLATPRRIAAAAAFAALGLVAARAHADGLPLSFTPPSAPVYADLAVAADPPTADPSSPPRQPLPPSLGQQPLVLPPVPNPTPSQTNTNQLNQLFLFENTPDICAAGEGYLTGDFRFFKLPGNNREYRYQLQGQYGVTDQIAAGAFVPVVTPDRATTTRTGLGDITLYAQYKFDQLIDPAVVDVTGQVDLVLPTGSRSEARDNAQLAVRPLLLAYKDFGQQGPGDLGFYGLVGTTITSHIDLRIGVAATYEIERFVGVVELTDETGVRRGVPQLDVTPGLAYRGLGPLVLQVGIPVGVNSGSPDYGVVVKATWAFAK